ncbi:MAG: NAD(P)H-dependent oxidoreductase [Patescibacteria group bacterium]|nr:NAD(P)H-dependent oxidoreductase [Patescibacteria group bacterium]
MPKYLIVYAHPNREGHCGYLLGRVQEQLEKQQADWEILDLYALNYDPVLKDSELYTAGRREVSPENLGFQEKIKAADRLLFIYPTWWQNMPAVLKGFLDRVFASHFGFVYKNGLPVGLLKGKKAAAFTTSGGPLVYTRFFTGSSSLRVLLKHTLGFCGMQTKGFLLGGAQKLEKNKGRLNKMAERIMEYLK